MRFFLEKSRSEFELVFSRANHRLRRFLCRKGKLELNEVVPGGIFERIRGEFSGAKNWVCGFLWRMTALHQDQRSIDGLICLTMDSSVEVRDWATFGLGSMTEQDTPMLRQALLARLDDLDDIVRGEALVGLARRQDERVIEPLRRALESGTYKNGISDYAGEVLAELQDLEKYPQLMTWKTND